MEETLAFVRSGDSIVVWKLDRLGRSLKHLIELLKNLQERGIEYVSLTEQIDTTTPGGKLIFHLMGALTFLVIGAIFGRKCWIEGLLSELSPQSFSSEGSDEFPCFWMFHDNISFYKTKEALRISIRCLETSW